MQTIVAEHFGYEPGRMFVDEMVEGPFARWLHKHIATLRSETECVLTDDIDYELPLGLAGRAFGGWFVRHNLELMFDFRPLGHPGSVRDYRSKRATERLR